MRLIKKMIQIIKNYNLRYRLSTAYAVMLPHRIREKYFIAQNKKGITLYYSNIIEQLQANAQYRNIHKNERCFIVGNGPSLKKVDLTLLENEICFTVNFIHLSSAFETIRPTYHVLADPKLFAGEIITNELSLVKKIKELDPSPTLFLNYSIYKNAATKIDLSGLDVGIYVDSTQDVLGCRDWKIDLVTGLAPMHNVVQYAIQIAIYMGFSEIYLIGCDGTDFMNIADAKFGVSHGTHVYDVPQTRPTKYVEKGQRPKSSISTEQAFFSYYNTFRGYRLLASYCERNGISLTNCTENSVIDSLPYKNICEVINKH